MELKLEPYDIKEHKGFLRNVVIRVGTNTGEVMINIATTTEDKKAVHDYLVSKGIDAENIVFNAVNTGENTRAKYSNDGRYIGQEFLGYVLSQSIKIESTDVEKVERISREVTELLNKGVQFYSQSPRYYYTKLADLKIELILLN